MSHAVIRRASVLGLALVLLVAGTALADQLEADADSVDGVQSSVNLGDVAPGSPHSLDVAFTLTCGGSSHLPAGTAIAVYAMDKTIPADGDMTVADGAINVPAPWPADGSFCAGDEPAATSTASRVDLTAPTTEGNASFVVLYALDSEAGVSNNIALTVSMTVVAPPPADTVDPVLHDMPADLTVQTGGASAIVTWTDPTATDDTDPSPTVSCDPASGSSFVLGTTTVTCTAKDAAGNEAQASFTVTVVQSGPVLTGTWGRPLADAFPALVGRAGRTVPLKLDVRAGSAVAGPSEISAPTLDVARLAACTPDAAAAAASGAGTFTWADGVWQLNLDTSRLGTGCVRISAMTGSDAIASAVIQLVPDSAVTNSKKR